MRTVATLLAIAMCLGVAGCEEREQKIVASRLSPDGRHVLWVTNEYGGLGSGVVRVHITGKDQVPEPRTVVLRTPECSGAIVGWVDSVTVAVVYESLSANSFFRASPEMNCIQCWSTEDLEVASTCNRPMALHCRVIPISRCGFHGMSGRDST